MEMKSFILKYASKIMFYDVNIACYHGGVMVLDPRGGSCATNISCKRRMPKCLLLHLIGEGEGSLTAPRKQICMRLTLL